MFWTGHSTRGTPRDGTHHSRESTGSFGRDAVSTGHHGAGRSIHGTPRGGTHSSRDSTGFHARDHIMAGLHGMFRAGSGIHATPHKYCILDRSSLNKRLVCECCTRRTPQNTLDDSVVFFQSVYEYSTFKLILHTYRTHCWVARNNNNT